MNAQMGGKMVMNRTMTSNNGEPGYDDEISAGSPNVASSGIVSRFGESTTVESE